MSKHSIACIVAFAAVSLVASKASAAIDMHSPWVSGGISIGKANGGIWDGDDVVCFEQGGYGAGQGVVVRGIGDDAGLVIDFVIHGGIGNDNVTFVQSTTSSYCRSQGITSLSPLRYNGHYIDVNGRSGTDVIIGAQGDTLYFGDTGNDFLMTSSPIGGMLGGENDDFVISISPGSREGLFGQNGNDCLRDTTATFSSYDCGAGNDRSTNTTNVGPNCENLGVGCCLCF
jgi:hypothetical protein